MTTAELADATPRRWIDGFAVVYIILGLAAVLGGATYVVGKVAVAHVSPLTLSGVRYVPSALCLVLLLRLKERSLPTVRLADLPLIVAIGITGCVLPALLLYYGLRVADAGEASIIASTGPGIMALLAALLLRERLNLAAIGGLAMAFVGAGVITIANDGLNLSADHALADLSILGMATSVALYSVLAKFAMRRFSPLATSTYSCLVGAIMLAPLILLESGLRSVLAAPAEFWGALAFLVFVSSVLFQILWFHGVHRIGPGRAAVFGNVAPVAALTMSAIFLHEAITIVTVLGAAFVIGGILLTKKR